MGRPPKRRVREEAEPAAKRRAAFGRPPASPGTESESSEQDAEAAAAAAERLRGAVGELNRQVGAGAAARRSGPSPGWRRRQRRGPLGSDDRRRR